MILLTFFFVFLICYICIYYKLGEKNAFLSLSLAAVMIGFLIYVSTNLLSLYKLITHPMIWMLWCVALLISILVFVLLMRKKSALVNGSFHPSFENKSIKKMIVIGMFFASIIMLAYFTSPYNTDSFTYHLPRLIYWTRNKSVSHYAAGYGFQTTAPVLSSYILLHIYQLSGETDRLLSLAQAFAYILSSLLIYGISRKIGVDKLWSWIASIIFATSPIVFAEEQTNGYSYVWRGD